MRHLHRSLVGVGLVVLLAGCKCDLANTNYVLGGAATLDVTRTMADDSGSSSGSTYNPSSCISLPTGWSVTPQVTISNSGGNAPTPTITEQTASESAMQTSVPRSGYAWHCYSAYATPQDLGTSPTGQVTYTITPATFTDPVQLITTLGDAVANIDGGMAFQNVYNTAVPSTGEPRRQTVSGDPVTYNFNPTAPSQSTVALNGTLITANLHQSNTPLITLTPQASSMVVHSVGLPTNARTVGPVSLGNNLAVTVLTNSDNSLSVFSSSDASTWASADAGITLGSGETAGSLFADTANNRWVLLDTLSSAPYAKAYFLSNDSANRFSMTGQPAAALNLTADYGDIKGTADGLPALLGTNANGLTLARLTTTGWQYDTVSGTITAPQASAGLIDGNTLYLALAYNDGVNPGLQYGFFRYTLGSNTEMQKVSDLAGVDGESKLVKAGSRLLLTSTAGLSISTDNGGTWTTPLDGALLGTKWTNNGLTLDGIVGNQVLLHADMLHSGDNVQVRTNLLFDIDTGTTTLLGGSNGALIDSGPFSPNVVWDYVARKDSVAYQYAYEANGNLAINALPLAKVTSNTGGGAGTTGGGSGGGGSLSLAALGAVLMTALRWRRASRR